MSKVSDMIKEASKSVNPVSVNNIQKQVKRIYPESNVSRKDIKDFLDEEYYYAEMEKQHSVGGHFYT